METSQKLVAKDELTTLAKRRGIESWDQLIHYVKNLPYGRNQNRTDFSLVFTESKGTCSSKHALLKSIAVTNKVLHVVLIIGIYRMNHLNTPKIGSILIDKGIEYLPEAHCYLKINGIRTDVTTRKSAFHKIEKDIIQEKEIEAVQVGNFKVAYHKDFMKHWLKETKLKFSFDEVWQIRESCIANLTRI